MKPINKPLLYAFAFILYTTLFYGCGKAPEQSTIVTISPNSPPKLVQLNAQWNESVEGDSVQTGGAYSFKVPSAIYIVQGEAKCWNGAFYPCNGAVKTLAARLIIGDAVCDYSAPLSSDTALSLQQCSGIDSSIDVTLPKDTVIKLVNYNAPGQLVQTQFFLTP